MEIGILEMLVPGDILAHFEFDKAEDLGEVYRIHLLEKQDPNHIPKDIVSKGKVVLDGYMNPIELQTYPMKGKETYLYLKRRRWKLQVGNESSYNTYNFNEPGMKATKEFGAFLKEIGRG